VTFLEIQVDAEIQRISEIPEFLKNLIFLNLGNSRIPCMRLLGNFPSLKILKMARAELSDLSGLSGLPALEELYLPFNAVSDLQPISSLDFLAVLDLEGNQISSVNELQFLKNSGLKEVTLTGNPVLEEISNEDLKKILCNLEILEVGEYENEILEKLRERKEITPSTARAGNTCRTRASSAAASELTMSAEPFQGTPLDAIRFRRKLNK